MNWKEITKYIFIVNFSIIFAVGFFILFYSFLYGWPDYIDPLGFRSNPVFEMFMSWIFFPFTIGNLIALAIRQHIIKKTRKNSKEIEAVT
jgi:hypothetical protein